MRLVGKVAMITGAAKGVRGDLMGLGGATARLFAREGARVVVTDIDVDTGGETVSEIRKEGGDARFVRLDVTSEQQWIDVITDTVSSLGGLDILVNNAGTGNRLTVEETTVEVWDGQMEVHAKGVFLGTKHAIPEMRKGGGGSIVNMSSIGGIAGSVSSAAYHAAKGAIRLFTKAAAIQYAKDKIRVNSVHPGYVLTPLHRSLMPDPNALRLRAEAVPMGRYGTADEIAYGVLYLASDESSYVTGAELVIDGGITAQ